jgi:hypothetical protein
MMCGYAELSLYIETFRPMWITGEKRRVGSDFILIKSMERGRQGQVERASWHHGIIAGQSVGAGFEAVVPNPKLKLMDQVREVLRLKHYAIRTETCYCDWIRRCVRFPPGLPADGRRPRP